MAAGIGIPVWNTTRSPSFPFNSLLMRTSPEPDGSSDGGTPFPRRPFRSWRTLVGLMGLLGPWSMLTGLLGPEPMLAQSAVVDATENFRAEPNGTILGQLEPGTPLRVVAEEGNWLQVTVEGYVWTRSMQLLDDGDLDLIISEPEGENLRAEPQGRVAGRLVRGAQLEELERIPGWVRVRRTGWIWGPSTAMVEARASPAPEEPEPDPPEADEPEQPPSPAEETLAGIRAGPGGLAILGAPDGSPVAEAQPGAELHVLSRQEGWVRVQLEGWVRLPDEGDDAREDEPGLATRVTVAEIRDDPDRYRGRTVEVELQFISLEEAEAIRSDFYEGEPFLLTRAADGERSFAYVAVPPERVAEVENLSPLEDLMVVGRVRTGGAEFTGNPVLELVRFERSR